MQINLKEKEKFYEIMIRHTCPVDTMTGSLMISSEIGQRKSTGITGEVCTSRVVFNRVDSVTGSKSFGRFSFVKLPTFDLTPSSSS